MKIKFLLLISFSMMSVALNSQNLVPNPSFETGACPQGPGEIFNAIPWTQPTMGTSDYFNVCGATAPFSVSIPLNILGWQNARTGNAYAGLCAYQLTGGDAYREYIQAQLTSPMQAGTRYYVRFYVALADCVSYACDDIGAYFSANQVTANFDTTLAFTPQVANPQGNIITDKLYWTLITGSFIANGSEQYITIGNFHNDQNTDTVFLGNNYWNAAYYYVDDICVSNDSMECELAAVDDLSASLRLSLFPNPAVSELRVEFESENSEIVIMNIYSANDQLVQTITDQNTSAGTRSKTISVANLSEGMYSLEVVSGDIVTRKKFVVQR